VQQDTVKLIAQNGDIVALARNIRNQGSPTVANALKIHDTKLRVATIVTGQAFTFGMMGPTRNAALSGIENCKSICDAHPECAGFVEQTTSNVCGFWDSGPLNIAPSSDYNCLRKLGCKDQPPLGYGNGCTWGCKKWADNGNCNGDWSDFDCGSINGMVKNDCKLSCNNCD